MHQRGHWLFINKLLNAGAIQWVARDGGTMTPENQVLAVVNYDQFQSVARAVLGELQAIKANREEKQLNGAVQRVLLHYRRSNSPGRRQSSAAANIWRLTRATWNSLGV